MQDQNGSFCIVGVPCSVVFSGIGEFVTYDWGLAGFRLCQFEALAQLDDEHSVALSLVGEGALTTKMKVRAAVGADDDACFHFVDLSASQKIALFAMVVAASVLKLAHSSK